MLAVIGFLVTEAPVEYHPLFETGSKDIGPAIRHLDEVRAVVPTFFEFLTIFIGAIELNRALVGWTAPSQVYDTGLQLKEEYYPGDGKETITIHSPALYMPGIRSPFRHGRRQL
eukprot:scaffold38567_cov305-Amphora_coffeaeformis.AAC.1